MIEKLIARFIGAYSYEEGLNTLSMAAGRIDGNNNLIVELKESSIDPIPIILTLKNTKFKKSYDNEKPLSITIDYINQDDVSKQAECTIPIYAEAFLDFRIIMPEINEFVKEITGITLDLTDIGDIGDNFEIIGLVGNISRILGVKALLLSDSFYALKIAALQKYVEIAWDGGLRTLAEDFGLNLPATQSQNEIRALARLFSSFIVPSKSALQENADIVTSLITEIDTILVSADFDNPYKVIYDVIWNSLVFDADSVKLLEIIVERYRPVPATTNINIEFEDTIEDSGTISDEAVVEITQSPVLFSSALLFGFTFGGDLVTDLPLPNTYP